MASLMVTDPLGASGTTQVQIAVGSAPTVTIDQPVTGTTWVANQQLDFSGHASDAEDGPLADSALSWDLILHHCPDSCHEHFLATYDEVSGGTFTAPDHEYPSYLELRLTATDSSGLKTTASLNLNPQTVNLTFQSAPTGLLLAVGSASQATPFTRTVIVGSSNAVNAPSPQTIQRAGTFAFYGWSDGGAQAHSIIAPATPTTIKATYAVPVSVTDAAFTPRNVRVAVGTAVTWTFVGPGSNTVTAPGVFDSGVKPPGSTFSFVFNSPGTYQYRNTLHPTVRGKIVVR